MIQAARKFYHSKTPLFRARGVWKAKMKALHIAVFPCVAWCAGTLHGTQAESCAVKAA